LQFGEGTAIVGWMMNSARTWGVAIEGTLPLANDEAALVEELKSGSEEAFAYLLAVYQNPVYNFICHMVENGTDASDVLQDVFVKVFKGIGHFHGESSLKTWIYRIAVHEATNHRRSWFRRSIREAFSLDDDHAPTAAARVAEKSNGITPYQALEQAERQELVAKALSSLAAPYRAVVVLREIEGQSYEEIARVLGVAEGTVKSRLLRGRDLLRRKLAGYMGCDDV
jgi:RNA polymerase sigma-70 factor, ECF subfamily